MECEHFDGAICLNIESNYYGCECQSIDCSFSNKITNNKKILKECLDFLPRRFHEEFLYIIGQCDQTTKTIKKNLEYYLESIIEELSKKEKERMFVIL